MLIIEHIEILILLKTGLSNLSETVCSVRIILLKLFPRLTFVTQCPTLVSIIDVQWAVIVIYILYPI